MTVHNNFPDNGDKRYEYVYDYLRRMVRRQVEVWDPTSQPPDCSTTADGAEDPRCVHCPHFVCCAVSESTCGASESTCGFCESTYRIQKKSRGLQPARSAAFQHVPTTCAISGRGGTIALRDVSLSMNLICFFDGAGNLGQLVDRSDASVDAKYVYDVIGDTVRNTGTFADTNPLRFGAMYYDAELDYVNTSCDGLYCSAAGNFYSPRLGRTFTRSPSLPAGGSPYGPGGSWMVGYYGDPGDDDDQDDDTVPPTFMDCCDAHIEDSEPQCVPSGPVTYTILGPYEKPCKCPDGSTSYKYCIMSIKSQPEKCVYIRTTTWTLKDPLPEKCPEDFECPGDTHLPMTMDRTITVIREACTGCVGCPDEPAPPRGPVDRPDVV